MMSLNIDFFYLTVKILYIQVATTLQECSDFVINGGLNHLSYLHHHILTTTLKKRYELKRWKLDMRRMR